MSLIGKIQTLFSDKERTTPVFPRTKVKAVSDDNGIGLDALLEEMNTATSNAQSTANTAQSTANNAMPKSGGDFTGTVYLQPWQGVSTKVGDANNTDIRFYVDTNGHAVLAVFQNGSWARTLFEADMNGNYHRGILMPKSGDTFTGDAVHFYNYRANVGSWYGSNTDHNAHLATVGEDGLISHICIDNNMGAFVQQWKDGQYIKGAKVMTDAGGTFTGNAIAYSTNRTTSSLRNIEIRKSSASGTLQSTNKIIMVRK